MEHVTIFDTTLRDGEQAPGASMDLKGKLALAEQLERLRVDVIEAGFPASSPADLEMVREVARLVKDCRVAALARARREDVEAAAAAVRLARAPRIHVFIATSAIHIEHKLRTTPQQVLEATDAAVRQARNACDDVQWSSEDCTRTDYEFMCRTFETAIRAGARTVTIADTVGYTTPDELKRRIRHLYDHVSGMDRVTLAIHCHDDLGMATANSLAGLEAGAREVQCTVNGIGERAGNASLEEIVMAIVTRPDLLPFELRVNTHELLPTSRLVSRITGFPVPPNKAVVGANAFAHESGIHQHGVLQSPVTYEIIRPEVVGAVSSEIVIGRHSGRHGLQSRLLELGLRLSESEVVEVLLRLKADLRERKSVTNDDIHQIAQTVISERTSV